MQVVLDIHQTYILNISTFSKNWAAVKEITRKINELVITHLMKTFDFQQWLPGITWRSGCLGKVPPLARLIGIINQYDAAQEPYRVLIFYQMDTLDFQDSLLTPSPQNQQWCSSQYFKQYSTYLPTLTRSIADRYQTLNIH